MRFSAAFGSNSWRAISPLTTSQPPTVAFSLERRAVADGLVPLVVADVPYGSVQADYDRLRIVRPELFRTDDVMLSIELMSQMIVGLGHGTVANLPRAAIDDWLALRQLLDGAVRAETPELSAIYRRTRSLLDHLRAARGPDNDAATLLKRARNACALLLHRASADLSPALRDDPEITFDEDALEMAAIAP